MGFGRGKTLGKFGDPLEGDLGATDDGKDGHHLFEWSLLYSRTITKPVMAAGLDEGQ